MLQAVVAHAVASPIPSSSTPDSAEVNPSLPPSHSAPANSSITASNTCASARKDLKSRSSSDDWNRCDSNNHSESASDRASLLKQGEVGHLPAGDHVMLPRHRDPTPGGEGLAEQRMRLREKCGRQSGNKENRGGCSTVSERSDRRERRCGGRESVRVREMQERSGKRERCVSTDDVPLPSKRQRFDWSTDLRDKLEGRGRPKRTRAGDREVHKSSLNSKLRTSSSKTRVKDAEIDRVSRQDISARLGLNGSQPLSRPVPSTAVHVSELEEEFFSDRKRCQSTINHEVSSSKSSSETSNTENGRLRVREKVVKGELGASWEQVGRQDSDSNAAETSNSAENVSALRGRREQQQESDGEPSDLEEGEIGDDDNMEEGDDGQPDSQQATLNPTSSECGAVEQPLDPVLNLAACEVGVEEEDSEQLDSQQDTLDPTTSECATAAAVVVGGGGEAPDPVLNLAACEVGVEEGEGACELLGQVEEGGYIWASDHPVLEIPPDILRLPGEVSESREASVGVETEGSEPVSPARPIPMPLVASASLECETQLTDSTEPAEKHKAVLLPPSTVEIKEHKEVALLPSTVEIEEYKNVALPSPSPCKRTTSYSPPSTLVAQRPCLDSDEMLSASLVCEAQLTDSPKPTVEVEEQEDIALPPPSPGERVTPYSPSCEPTLVAQQPCAGSEEVKQVRLPSPEFHSEKASPYLAERQIETSLDHTELHVEASNSTEIEEDTVTLFPETNLQNDDYIHLTAEEVEDREDGELSDGEIESENNNLESRPRTPSSSPYKTALEETVAWERARKSERLLVTEKLRGERRRSAVEGTRKETRREMEAKRRSRGPVMQDLRRDEPHSVRSRLRFPDFEPHRAHSRSSREDLRRDRRASESRGSRPKRCCSPPPPRPHAAPREKRLRSHDRHPPPPPTSHHPPPPSPPPSSLHRLRRRHYV